VHLAAILAATQPALQFDDRRLECGIEAVGASLAADHRTATPRGDLHALTGLTLAAVAFMIEFDVEQVDGSVEPFQSGEFLGDIDAEVIGDLDVAALEHDLGGQCRFGGLVGSNRCLVQNLTGFHG
jgi:hypothetical protein